LNRHDLKLTLQRYEPSDSRELEYRVRMLNLLGRPDALRRHGFTPGHFTASAFVLCPDRTHLLMIHHKFLGLWLQPGGHVELDDASICDAARREVAEETGVFDVEDLGLLDLDIHAIPANPLRDEPAHEHFDVRWLFCARTRVMTVGDEVLGARWVAINEVQDVGTDDSVLRAVRKIDGGSP
jgi:8-oxo-dGTP pyrophosphatase MutT (NUDIX family)